MKMSIADEYDETLRDIYEIERTALRRAIFKLAKLEGEYQDAPALSEVSTMVSKYTILQRLNNQIIKETNMWGVLAATPELMLRELNEALLRAVAKHKLHIQCRFTSTYNRGIYKYGFEAMDVSLMPDKKEELANVLLI